MAKKDLGPIRRATPAEAGPLSELAVRSKAHWGYSKEFLAACCEELALDEDYINANPTFVLEADGVLIGFYALERLSPMEVELGYLFVDPASIGKGYGRALIEHAKQEAQRRAYGRLIIQGDPHAEGFYRAAGGVVVGSRESASIAGRRLPLFHLELS